MQGPPRHFTNEPWWIIPLAGIVAALLPLLKHGQFQRATAGVGLLEGMAIMGALGVVASSLLVVRSRIKSTLWSNVVLWLGILLIALGVCAAAILFGS